jgi:hypothetical protein
LLSLGEASARTQATVPERRESPRGRPELAGLRLALTWLREEATGLLYVARVLKLDLGGGSAGIGRIRLVDSSLPVS